MSYNQWMGNIRVKEKGANLEKDSLSRGITR